MGALSTQELVLVHLLDAETPDCRTTAGICEAFGVGTSVSERVGVLSALSSLQEQELLVAQHRTTDDRTVYSLTEEGTSAATDRRDLLADRTVEVVTDDGSESMSLSAARDELGLSSVAGVLRQSTNGRLRVDSVPDDTFVGRDAELASLMDAMTAIEDGRRGTVSIVGERGVGKTELLRRLIIRAGDRGIPVVPITCRADPDEPFEALREALSAYDSADVFDRHTGTLDSAGGLTTRRIELFGDLVSVVDSIAGDGPVLVTVDDLHEAGDAVCEFLDFFTNRLPDGALVVTATRPVDLDERALRLADEHVTETDIECDLELGPLSRDQTRELVVRSLGDSSVPESLIDRLYEQTGGTPLFVIEMVARLRETGVIDADTGLYPTADAELPVPDDVSQAVELRLGALDEPARTVLEDAALIGHTVDPAVLKAISEAPEPTVQEYLDLLVDTGLLDGAEPIQFLSEITREVLLDRIDEGRKRQRHERIAEAYGELFEDPPHAAVARHYEQAGRPEDALTAYRAAGDQAIEVYAHEESLDQYERALSLARELDDDEALVDIVESIGRVHYVTGEYDEANRYFEYLREQTDDPDRIQTSYRYQSELASDRGELERADEYAQAGIDAVDEPTRVSCRLIGHRGWYRFQRGDTEAAEEYFKRQYDLADQLEDEDRLAGAYHNLGMVAQRRGDVDRAMDLLERAAEYNERSGSSRDALASYNNLSIIYQNAGRIDDAIEALETVRDRAAEIGDRPTEIMAIGNISLYDQLRGNLDRAEQRAQEAIEAARTMGLAANEATALHASGVLRIERCQFEAAGERIERAVELYESTGNARLSSSARGTLSRLALYQDRLETAREHAEIAVDLSEGSDLDGKAMAQYRLGDVELASDNVDGAIEAYERSLEHVEAGASVQTAALAKLRLAMARSVDGDAQDGIDLAREAVEVAETIGAPMILARALTAVACCHRLAGEYDTAASTLDDATAAIDGIDVPLYTCWIRVERALLAADRGDADANRSIEDAATFAEQRGVALLVRRCQQARGRATGPKE